MLANKNIRDHKIARTTRLRSKIQAANQHSHNFHHLEFMFPEPTNDFTLFKPKTTASKTPKDNITQIYDERRDGIKEKIKFRIKQQLYSLLQNTHIKRGKDQEADYQTTEICGKKEQPACSTSSYIRGRSFTRLDIDGKKADSKKNWSMVSTDYKNIRSQCSSSHKQRKTDQNQQNRRRLWSSVKMKQSDKAVVFKKQNVVSKNCISLQRLDLFQIQPWKASEDTEQEHQLFQ